MTFPENTIIKELIWEYDYTKSQAKAIVSYYKKANKYSDLCELIQYRLSIKLSEEELYNVCLT